MPKLTKPVAATALGAAMTIGVFAGAAMAEPSAELVAAAKKEGQLTTIALARSWCGYGGVIDAFKAKYPEIKVNELNPDGSSADELEAVRANKTNKGPQAPDVIDVGLAFGPQAKAEGLIAPYKVATWDEIPADVKDADGHWFADYYGVMAFGVNSDIVKTAPADWADLLKSEYAASFALTGDPRASNQAILGVMSAGLSKGVAPGAESGRKGLEFFAELNKKGNFVPVTAKAGTLAQGQTPIIAGWDYNLLAWRDSLKGNPPVKVVIPSSNSLAGVYVQAISAYAPHPNAARLWMEYLYSDEGQIGWLKGYCHPARFAAMSKAGKIPKDLLDKLPPAEAYEKAVFPTIAQQEANKAVVTADWDKTVGANVK
jgi:putative spermidine/putrescine transport system substrate-binding protein